MLSQKGSHRSIWPFRLQLINFRSDFDKSTETQETLIPLTEVVPQDKDPQTEEEEEGTGGSSDNMDIQDGPRKREGGLLGDETASSERDLLLPSDDSSVLLKRSKRSRGFLVVLTFFAALGGFLFGYDTGVVSGAMIKVREDFSLSSTLQEAVVSVTVGAAALAAAVGGPTSDLIGRKPILLIASVVFTVGAIVMGVAWYAWILLIGRVVVGVGIGFAAMAVPMYIAEMAPAKMRGFMVVVNNLGITGGQFVATVIDGVFSYLPVNIGWRYVAYLMEYFTHRLGISLPSYHTGISMQRYNITIPFLLSSLPSIPFLLSSLPSIPSPLLSLPPPPFLPSSLPPIFPSSFPPLSPSSLLLFPSSLPPSFSLLPPPLHLFPSSLPPSPLPPSLFLPFPSLPLLSCLLPYTAGSCSL